jgi:hypothetical protein
VPYGDPDYPNHHHIGAREHSCAPDHPDGHGVDRRTTARYRDPPRPVAGLPGGAVSADSSLAS